MKILVTGACGYVGSVLTQSLLDLGHEVIGFDAQWFGNFLAPHPKLTLVKGDIRNSDLIPLDGVEVVFHLANVANDPCSDLDPKLSWEVNALASVTLAERLVQAGVKQLVFASSGSVYGVKEEDEVTEDLSLVPISDYNKTKMVSERVFLSYAEKLTVNVIRPATVCGISPRMRLDLTVNMLTMQALENGKITVLGGDQTRPNIHIKDLVAVYLHFLNSGKALPGVYNAGFENLSVSSIAEMIVQKVPAEIVVLPSNDPRSYRLCSKKLTQTGFTPQLTIADAISEIVSAYQSKSLRSEERWYNIKTMKASPEILWLDR
jgi:nucleoside-diphosphate-sugar epimerase